MSSAVQLTRDLVEINSANPATCPDGPGAARILAWCAQLLRERGFETWRGDDRSALVARRAGERHGPVIALVGHTDTVGWWRRPVERGGVLIGAGAMDMKGGVAMILAAVADIAHEDQAGDLVVVMTPDEESDSAALRQLVPTLTADLAIVTESSGLQLGVRHGGSVTATIEPPGTGSASLGILRRRLAGHPRPLISSGDGRWRVRLPLRSGDAAAPAVVRLRQAAAVAGLRVVHLDVREPLDTPPTAVGWVHGALGTVGRRHGHVVYPVGTDGWTEAGILGAHGVPSVVFGPRGWGAHTPDERIRLADVALGAQLLGELLAELARPMASSP